MGLVNGQSSSDANMFFHFKYLAYLKEVWYLMMICFDVYTNATTTPQRDLHSSGCCDASAECRRLRRRALLEGVSCSGRTTVVNGSQTFVKGSLH